MKRFFSWKMALPTEKSAELSRHYTTHISELDNFFPFIMISKFVKRSNLEATAGIWNQRKRIVCNDSTRMNFQMLSVSHFLFRFWSKPRHKPISFEKFPDAFLAFLTSHAAARKRRESHQHSNQFFLSFFSRSDANSCLGSRPAVT